MTGLFSYPKRKLKKLVHDGEYKKALSFGKSIESEYQNDPDFLFIMGSVYYILEDAKNCMEYFDKTLQYRPKDTECLLLKANVHLALKQKSQAVECCEKILDIEPKNNDANNLLDKLAMSD